MPDGPLVEALGWLCLEHASVENRAETSCRKRTVYQDWPESRATRLPCRFVKLFYVDDGAWTPIEFDINEERRQRTLAEHPYPWNEAKGTD